MRLTRIVHEIAASAFGLLAMTRLPSLREGKQSPKRRWVFFSTLFLLAPAAAALDVVISGGRVMDPESGLDAVRDIGIEDGAIVAVSKRNLAARAATVIDATGLVVAPGFIDLHAHGQSDRAFEYRVRDGVTSALELEAGFSYLAQWLELRRGKARIHYGASVSHSMTRAQVQPENADRLPDIEALFRRVMSSPEPLDALADEWSEGLVASDYREVPESHTAALFAELERGLKEGGIGIGMGHQYYPGASYREIFRVFQFAADKDVPIFVHVRTIGLGAMQEVIANAAATGVSLHIVHVNSMSLDQLPEVLALIGAARERGVDVTTEAYPYTAASTYLESAFFDEGWQELLGISYPDLQWQDTGERLNEESFARYRAQGGAVIIHMMKEEMIELALTTPHVMIGSDAMPYAPGAHPRSAGTFARVLGRYVRDRQALGLMAALGKMTLLPARRLEDIAPAMKNKGRIRLGADADIVVFDEQNVMDTATFEAGLSFSKGIQHVLVAGVSVVRDGLIVEGAYPGQPVVGRYSTAESR